MRKPNRIVYLCSSDDESFIYFEDILLCCQYFLDYIILLEYCVQDLRLLPWDIFLDNREQHREELHKALWDACSRGEVNKARQLIKQLGRETELIINSTPNGCSTLLFKACEEGQKEIVKLLLENGADGRIHPITKYSPLYIACYYGRKDITEIIIKKFPELVVVTTVEKWLPIHAAVINGHLQVLDLLLKYPYESSVLQRYVDKTQKWEYFFPFDINAKDVTEQTVLYVACLVGNQRIVDLLLKFKVPAKRIKKEDGSDDERKDDEHRSGSNISPTKKRLSTGIQSVISKLSLRNNTDKEEEHSETEISPLDLDLYCNNNTETALHIAIKKKYHSIVQLLLQNSANPNLSIKQSTEELNRANDNSGSSSTALVEACKNRDVNMVDCLVRYGARDDQCKALKVATANKDEHIASKLLTLKAYQDPEFKINKKALEIVPSTHLGGLLGSVTFSSMFPTTPVMINWHGQKCLHYIKEEWLLNASMAHNVKLKLTARNQSSALMAITRLDISNNQLTELPLCIFQMASLRHFNAANNKIFKLPEADKNDKTSSSSPKTKRDIHSLNQSGWCCPVLEEIHLHDNRLDCVPACLFTLPSLTVLDLSNNKLQSLPFKMWFAPKLRELNLSLNMLHDLPSKPPPVRSISASRLTPSISEDQVNSTESSPRHSTVESFESSGDIPNLLSPVFEPERRFKVDGDLRQQELLHHNFWSSSIKIVESSNGNETGKNQKCQLAALNLAHNAYETIPPILSCFAVNLARLNMSYNRLTEMGPVSSYPACLKHLDLSHNRIKTWLTTRRIDPDLNTESSSCYSQTESMSAKMKPSSTSSSGRTQSPSLHSWGSAKSLTGLVCQHRRHNRLDNLRTLILADNELDRLILILDEDDFEEEDSKSSESFETLDPTGKVLQMEIKSKILFPNLSMLDVSNNKIDEVPAVISEFNNLSVLNLSGNVGICHLPPEMGLLGKLWNLNTRMCNLTEPLRSMIDSKKYKTMDVIGYLKSILEDAKPYARMKLMIVGIEGIGKTSLLEQLRIEGTGAYRKKPPEHWAKRTGNKNINLKTAKGINISTVGVDVGDWIYEKKIRGQSSYGPVVFRTWDFGGQKEYYATHQYFLSKRSLYLVTWRIIDGERGVDGILQWLVNIQARAPNAPVIIIGTHYDLVKERFPPSYSEDLQQMIRDRFINVVDADKCGLPRVIDTIEISCKTRHNIKLLCNLIYDTVFDLKCPGSKERLLEQKIPATYLALEDVVGLLAVERHVQGKDPVLRAENYRNMVMHEMMQRYNIAFRDLSELNQASTFLHENGILLHYEDATLKDLYFLDPQWLCDMLAHVVTIREINPFARNGIMKIEDLKHVFKSSQFAPSDAQTYILNLLNKFEVALTWDNRTIIIPSLLPSEEQLRAGFPGCDVRVPVRSRVWAMRKSYGNRHSVSSAPLTLKLTTTEKRPQRPLSDIPLTADCIGTPKISDPMEKDSENSGITCYVRHKTQIESVVRRLLLMSYFPSGFWSRLMTRMLADDIVVEIIRSYFLLPKDVDMDPLLAAVFNRRAEWICWQTGMELRYLDTTLFRMKEHLSHLNNAPFEYRQMKFFVQQEGSWSDIEIINSAILEIILPNQTVVIQIPKVDADGIIVAYDNVELQPNSECVAKLLSVSVDHIDTLLEDWYPNLGTRFVHTSEGKFLVTRLVPCTQCVVAHVKEETGSSDKGHFSVTDHAWEPGPWHGEPPWRTGMDCSSRNHSMGSSRLSYSPNLAQKNRGSRNSTMSHDSDSGVGPDSNSSSRKPSTESRPEAEYTSGIESTLCIEALPETVIYSFMVEECILTAYEQRVLQCPLHGNQSLLQIAPDTVFVDLGERHLIPPDSVRRGKMLGRGAFGFVFKANIKQRGSNTYTEVAMKMLQPVDPGFGAKQSDTAAYKAAWNKWQRDPLQYACKAYCTARQELNILLALRHQNIVHLVGVCTKPLALVLQLAPMGALDSILKNYRRSGAKLDVYVMQKIIFQIAKALEYLHQQHIIYRDLKSENVLVWELPPPFHCSTPIPHVETKLADYGISRSTLPTGTKGFGGTEGFMAPEIMRYNGEEEYTEKVDCFSFGMFMYELITLHEPFEGQECVVKDYILEGGRPFLTKREMAYPTYLLDLMTLCWSHQPKDRPSASQIVSIAQAPELTHLIDVASLHDQMAVLSACVTALPPKTEEQSIQDDQWELWFSRLGKQMDILTCSRKSWLEYKTLTLETVTVTCLCVVGDDLWLGDSKARVHIYNIADHSMVTSFSVDPHAPTVSAIRSMCTLPGQNGVAMATSGGQLWLCCIEDTNTEENKTDARDSPKYNIEELINSGGSIFCITSIDLGNNCSELWCGQTQGKISIYSAINSSVTGHEIVYHYDPVVDNLDVYQLVGGFSDKPIVWSYVYPGCVAYQWDTVKRTILHKLDCSKLAPCSESLMSISIEEHLSPGRCQVTAMASVGSDLYIGTTWGCIVVAEGTTMRPITVFRPFEEEVKAILPLLGRKTENKDSSSPNNNYIPYIATVGKGYRNLIGRYTPINAPLPYQDNMYLLLWRADNWAAT
ncbi:leucine-rich repeat serine/threonine-protein kinase 1 isoform X3 [Parasteatoda tepidariorum]|uniref:leucine-rich repeat serine/threonine-protein kinase 1 isoform X3 n=1 Tax=Parasteatoda tepidariorum TaxID=114398 RepID=UPI0039BCB202